MKIIPKPKLVERKVPTPREIYNHLHNYVIGQEQAKRTLAVAAYNHLKRTQLPPEQKGLFRKSNVLLIGPTGSGKTRLAQTLASALDAPYASVDITEYTQMGYQGKDVDHMFGELLYKAHHSVEMAQRGIVFIDEIDKLAKRSTSPTASVSRDIAGEGVQQALLTLLEGREILASLPQSGTRKAEAVPFHTGDILFIAAGTFSELHSSSGARIAGFGASSSSASSLQPKDLVAYGMLAELVGRLPLIAQLDPLEEDQLVAVLTEPPDALVREYQQWLALDNVTLEFTPEALRAIARASQRTGTGARALRQLMERICHDIMFEAPEHASLSVRFTQEDVEQRLGSLS